MNFSRYNVDSGNELSLLTAYNPQMHRCCGHFSQYTVDRRRYKPGDVNNSNNEQLCERSVAATFNSSHNASRCFKVQCADESRKEV